MEKLKWAGSIAGGVVAVFAISWAGATTLWTCPYKPDLMASWVQATGAIAAIVGSTAAVWWQVKRQATQTERIRLQDQAERDRVKFETDALHLKTLEREIANLAFDSTNFLARHADDAAKWRPHVQVGVDEAEFQEILQRLAWIRQQSVSKTMFDEVISIRSCVVEAAFMLRVRNKGRTLEADQLKLLGEYLGEVRDIHLRLDHLRRGLS